MKIVNIDRYATFPKNTLYCGRNPKHWKACVNTLNDTSVIKDIKNKISQKPLYGNPFSIGSWKTRDDIIKAHYVFTCFKTLNPEYLKRIHDMKNFDLACHCKPLTCHCDNYVKINNNNHQINIFHIVDFIIFLGESSVNFKDTIYSDVLRSITFGLMKAGVLVIHDGKMSKDMENININHLKINDILLNTFELMCMVERNRKDSWMFIDAFLFVGKAIGE